MNNIQNIMRMYAQFKQNPGQVFDRLSIPQEYRNDPQNAIQYLIDNGRINQSDYDNMCNRIRQMQNVFNK